MSFATSAETLRALLVQAGIAVQESAETASLSPNAINRQANGMTVLVSCWD